MIETWTRAVFFVILGVAVLANDCVYQECLCNDGEIICEARQLTQVPLLVESNLTEFSNLYLNVNNISVIPSGSLPANLTGIFLQENPLTAVEDEAFVGSSSTLTTVFLTQANFSKFPDAFLRLTALDSLYIFDSQIQDWNDEAMSNIGQTVQHLHLKNVGLTKWPPWIQYFSQLTALSLSSGSISEIPDQALDNVTDMLDTLDLQKNSLSVVPMALSKLTALLMLFLNDNRIVNVTWLPQVSKLSTLMLHNNHISDHRHLSDALRPYENSLFELGIHGNQLTTVSNLTFLEQVSSLDLSYNNISDMQNGSVSPLLYSCNLSHNLLPFIPQISIMLERAPELTLSSNSISQIRGTDFPPFVIIADLASNHIAGLADDSFPPNSKLQILRLNDNPLANISNLAFQYLTHLTELHLQNTKLTRLPFGLAYIYSLSILNMADNRALVCTCQEKFVQTRILSMDSYNVLGNCGQTDIYTFFSQLSSFCPKSGVTDYKAEELISDWIAAV